MDAKTPRSSRPSSMCLRIDKLMKLVRELPINGRTEVSTYVKLAALVPSAGAPSTLKI